MAVGRPEKDEHPVDYRHILIAVDGSPPSLYALDQVFTFPGGRLTAAAVIPPLPGGLEAPGPEVADRLQVPYEQALARCRELAAARGLDPSHPAAPG